MRVEADTTPTLVVIGGASLDVLHFAGRIERSAGGAGLYTSLAAHRAGARVTMLGPRPSPVPAELREAIERLDWRGPIVPPEELPSFEIAHHGGGVSEMRQVIWRSESRLSIASLPGDLPAGWVYCIPLADPALQLEFVQHFHDQGRIVACGTFSCAIAEQPEVVRKTLEIADVFFCNEKEAVLLFGSLGAARTGTGKQLFITRSAAGARVVQGEHVTDVPGVPVDELDPTGAGDTFCGTVLAGLLQGLHPIRSAQAAVAAAAEMVTRVGPIALLQAPPPPSPASDPRVSIDRERLVIVASVLAGLDEVEPFDFVGRHFPEPGHPQALDFFFSATLQQFGFWSTRDGSYAEPMRALLAGERLKGSDFLWAAYRRWLEEDPGGLTPRSQAALDPQVFDHRLRDDAGGNPLPAAALHLQQAQTYGADMVDLGWTPGSLIANAAADSRPLLKFLMLLDRIGGYKEDGLRKKSVLLAAILRARPECFLDWPDQEELPPIIDYHLQRSCLRIGLIRLVDAHLARRIEQRQVIDEASESAIRAACFEVLELLREQSGKSMAALDWFFFQNRSRCPEMSEPACEVCPVVSVCARHTHLFQPVLRTTFY